jgi:hypothetical protein
VFGAAGVGEAGAGVGIVGGGLHVGFHAGYGPPAVGIALRSAHSCAAAARMRFRAMAIALGEWNTAQHGGSVGEECEGAQQESKPKSEESADRAAEGEGFPGEPAHEGILRGMRKKTDSAGSSKILLPGSWNWAAEEQQDLGKDLVPDKVREAVPNRAGSADLGLVGKFPAELKSTK